jgi:hypothetical protein
MTTWTQDDIARLEKAVGKGVRSVTYQSGTVTYHSLSEMFQLLDRMRGEVGPASESQVIFAARIR